MNQHNPYIQQPHMPLAPNGSMQQPSMSQEGGMRMPQQPMQQEGGISMQGQGMAPQGPMMPPQGGMMPPQMSSMPNRPGDSRERVVQGDGANVNALMRKNERIIPNWITGRSIFFYFLAMLACWVVFGYIPSFNLVAVASVSVLLFFLGSMSMAKSWKSVGEKRFLRNIFIVGFIVRFLWILYLYFFFNPGQYDTTYGDGGDVTWYMPFGQAVAEWIRNGFDIPFSELQTKWFSAIDDTGYPFWLGIIYLIFGNENEVFVPLLIKCILGAYCAVLIYRIAKRHFGVEVARISAIFSCVNPNMIYWCGTMLKETEMVFLCCLAIDNFDRVLTSGKRFTFRNLLPGILAGLALMFFRSALGLVIFLAVFAHIVIASRRVMSTGKKILAGILVGAVLAISMGDRIRAQSQEMIETVQSDKQEKNMKWRAEKEDGNIFAKYAGAAVFAPLIFTIPFPTFNMAQDKQILQVQLAGGSYIKNIFSFFVIMVMFIMLISGEWRRHVFILSYTLGYLFVLVMSTFAQSGRFHMPVIPMLIIFAAYGIQITKNNKKVRTWFPFVLVLEVVICLGWNWFKLAGRGMI